MGCLELSVSIVCRTYHQITESSDYEQSAPDPLAVVSIACEENRYIRFS